MVSEYDQSSWKLTEVSHEELKQLAARGALEYRKQNGVPGAIEQKVFQVQPLSHGTTRIEFQYVRPWDKANPAKTFVITFRVSD
jgi:predicted secreted protein